MLNGPCKKLIRVLAMAKVWAFEMCYVVLFLLCIIDNKNPYEICLLSINGIVLRYFKLP